MEDAPSTTAVPDADSPPGETLLHGTGTAPGIVVGTAHRFDTSAPEVRRERIREEEVEAELELLANAVQQAEQELETVRLLAHESLEADSEAIFEAQMMMLQDEELLGPIRERIRNEKESAGSAVKAVFQGLRERLNESPDEYLRERSGDLVDLEKRLLRALLHGEVASSIGAQAIVVAESLTATDVLRLNRYGMRGCVTVEGGPTSHASIIAQTLNIPMLVGVENLDAVSTGDPVVLDADQGRLILHPSPETVEDYEERRSKHAEPSVPGPQGEAVPPAVTTDGVTLPLRANVDVEDELALLDSYGVEGIGLLRPEMLLLARGSGMLSEEHQVEVYRKAASVTGEAGATIRLLDLGGDKRLPFGPDEANPALGWRGIRVLLDRPDELLRPQLRALLRANVHGNLRMLLPMVTQVAEVRRVRAHLEDEVIRLSEQDVAHDPNLPLGIMVEVPSTALQAEAFAEHVDFFSVGTNDLTQFVLAVDRNNDRVSSRFDPLHPTVLGLVRRTVEAGQAAGCPIEVCGESAADIQAVPVLLGLGVDALSAAPPSLSAVRRIIRSLSLEEAQALAREALEASDAETVRRRAREWIDARISLDRLSEEASTDSGASEASL